MLCLGQEAGVLCFGKFYAIIRDEATKFHLFHSLKSLLAKRTDYSIKVSYHALYTGGYR